MGLAAPRINSATLRLNGQDYGVYANIEAPNEDLINRVYGTGAKNLYEANAGGEWTPGMEDGFQTDVGDDMKVDLSTLFDAVAKAPNGTLLPSLAGHLDGTQFVRFSAAEAIVGHYDGYGFGKFGSHNYYLHGTPAGVFSLIPWSTDLSMSDRQGIVNAAEPANVGGMATVLMRCLADATCTQTYKDEMQKLLRLFAAMNLPALALRFHNQIDALVRADPKRESTLAYYDDETAALGTWLTARPAAVRAQLMLAP
jgi:spore coat protein CotH